MKKGCFMFRSFHCSSENILFDASHDLLWPDRHRCRSCTHNSVFFDVQKWDGGSPVRQGVLMNFLRVINFWHSKNYFHVKNDSRFLKIKAQSDSYKITELNCGRRKDVSKKLFFVRILKCVKGNQRTLLCIQQKCPPVPLTSNSLITSDHAGFNGELTSILISALK